MALLQNFESGYGVSFRNAYHKIIRAEYDFTNDFMVFYVAVFADQQARADSKKNLFVRKIIIKGITTAFDIRKKLYDYLKAKSSDYAESEDV